MPRARCACFLIDAAPAPVERAFRGGAPPGGAPERGGPGLGGLSRVVDAKTRVSKLLDRASLAGCSKPNHGEANYWAGLVFQAFQNVAREQQTTGQGWPSGLLRTIP